MNGKELFTNKTFLVLKTASGRDLTPTSLSSKEEGLNFLTEKAEGGVLTLNQHRSASPSADGRSTGRRFRHLSVNCKWFASARKCSES